MLSRLASTTVARFASKSSRYSVARASVTKSSKTGKTTRSLANAFSASYGKTSSLQAALARSLRTYSSQSTPQELRLQSAIKEFNRDATEQFDEHRLNDLLERNGWKMTVEDRVIIMRQKFDDATVTLEIMTDAPESSANPMMDELLTNQEGYAAEASQEGETDDDPDSAMLKSQSDWFNVVVNKHSKVDTKMIFGCQAKGGVLEILSVTFTDPDYAHTPGQFPHAAYTTPSGNSAVKSPLAPGAFPNRTLAFHELPEHVQHAFEDYLLDHNINHDLALLIHFALYKYDLKYDQEWAYRASQFLLS